MKSGSYKIHHNGNPANTNAGIQADFWSVMVFSGVTLKVKSNPFGSELNCQWNLHPLRNQEKVPHHGNAEDN